MTLRTVLIYTHRWIGLSTSIVLAVAGLTGAALVWDGPFPLRGTARRLHDSLALGGYGLWIVWIATFASIPLLVGGLALWWRRKALRIEVRKGWRRLLFDLHHAVGVVAFALMLVISVSAVVHGAFDGERNRSVRRVAGPLHTGQSFPFPVRVAYSAASSAFLLQSLSGFFMWWRSSMGPAGERR